MDTQELKRHGSLVCRRLKKRYPDAECALHHDSPFQLLVATILSAQCTDERVNLTTPALFKKYPTAEKLAAASQESVEKLIQSCGFFRSKANNLLGMAQAVVNEHDGEIPNDLESLVKLPGVGRKTANVILGVTFRKATGVVVDTHVKRISNRLGLTTSQNPEIIERDLMRVLPKSQWIDYSHRIIHHGRQICKARNPNCEECPLLSICPQVGIR
ncbi:endonuclease III [Calycomorphotria hydatis]|uniref:Endonuclease III n=1 Tax=Calycomorphotria hydatis TaxID=2528027 RepID=A0A517T897_9PLAN|nr:endonuclease III [Calycomorphotria hydatis]QDT64582.1 Ultraviolet N-glycosylase/AP lyase [Calycomorphotria hydatis]